jgi:hypothetical protein
LFCIYLAQKEQCKKKSTNFVFIEPRYFRGHAGEDKKDQTVFNQSCFFLFILTRLFSRIVPKSSKKSFLEVSTS